MQCVASMTLVHTEVFHGWGNDPFLSLFTLVEATLPFPLAAPYTMPFILAEFGGGAHDLNHKSAPVQLTMAKRENFLCFHFFPR